MDRIGGEVGWRGSGFVTQPADKEQSSLTRACTLKAARAQTTNKQLFALTSFLPLIVAMTACRSSLLAHHHHHHHHHHELTKKMKKGKKKGKRCFRWHDQHT